MSSLSILFSANRLPRPNKQDTCGILPPSSRCLCHTEEDAAAEKGVTPTNAHAAKGGKGKTSNKYALNTKEALQMDGWRGRKGLQHRAVSVGWSCRRAYLGQGCSVKPGGQGTYEEGLYNVGFRLKRCSSIVRKARNSNFVI